MSDEATLFLIIYPTHSGIAELNNVGVFEASDAAAAKALAMKAFNTTETRLYVTLLDGLAPGWTYYT